MGIERMFLKGNNDSKIEDFYIENSHEDGEECHVIIWRQLHKNREKMTRVTCKKKCALINRMGNHGSFYHFNPSNSF